MKTSKSYGGCYVCFRDIFHPIGTTTIMTNSNPISCRVLYHNRKRILVHEWKTIFGEWRDNYKWQNGTGYVTITTGVDLHPKDRYEL